MILFFNDSTLIIHSICGSYSILTGLLHLVIVLKATIFDLLLLLLDYILADLLLHLHELLPNKAQIGSRHRRHDWHAWDRLQIHHPWVDLGLG